MARIIIALIFVVAVFHSGSALKCYNCEGERSSDCGTMFWGAITGDKYLEECSALFSVTGARCQKTVQGNIVKRSCAANIANPCVLAGAAFDFCGICETDGCNGSTRLGSISAITLVSLIGATFFINFLRS